MRNQHRYLIEIFTAVGLIVAPFILPHLGFAPNTVNRILAWGLFGVISSANVWLVASTVLGGLRSGEEDEASQRSAASFHRCASDSGASFSGTSKLTEEPEWEVALSTTTSTR